MLAPVFRTIHTPAVAAIVSGRVYGAIAPEDVPRPYITWFTVADIPHANLSGPPLGDAGTVQIDCWAEYEAHCKSLAAAVRDALDAANIVNRIAVHTYERDENLYRIGLQADFIRNR